MSPELVTQCNYTWLNIRKIKFFVYIYICFNQNLDEKAYISAESKTVKHFLTVLQLNSIHDMMSPMSNQIVETHNLFGHHLKSWHCVAQCKLKSCFGTVLSLTN